MSSRHSKGKGPLASGSGKGRGGSGGNGPSKGPRAPPSNVPHVPSELSFYVRIYPLAPNFTQQGPRYTNGPNYWQPPDAANGFSRGDGPTLLLRWRGGRLSTIPADVATRGDELEEYASATVFTQRPDTPHLLAVPYDASLSGIRSGQDWQPLSFDHEQIRSTNTYYSYIDYFGTEQNLAARAPPHWIGQLVPAFYDCSPDSEEATRHHGGLVGNLPLLLSLAVFSAPPTELAVLTDSVQPGAWVCHGYGVNAGHIPERGVLVTIYLDPHNRDYSTGPLLDRLQRGDYGPFYGP